MSYRELCSQLGKRQYRRPFFVLNALFLLTTFSGKFAIGFYAVEVFRAASHSVDEYTSAIVVGFIKLVGSFLYLPAIRYFSRRTLLCLTSLTMGVSLIVLGLSVYSHEKPDSATHMLSELGWLPLLCVVVYMLADPVGLGSIPHLYAAEFYPSEMRSFLSGITAGLANLEMFLVVKTFPGMNAAMGAYSTFWLYSGVCFAAVVFTLFFIPETKGKSLQVKFGLISVSTRIARLKANIGKGVRRESIKSHYVLSPKATIVLSRQSVSVFSYITRPCFIRRRSRASFLIRRTCT